MKRIRFHGPRRIIRTLGSALLAGICWLASPSSAQAAGDRALGEHLSSECSGCHQSNGRQVGGIPAIVGLPEDQFVALMSAYRSRQRDNAVMIAIAGRLAADEIAALATYYGDLKPTK